MQSSKNTGVTSTVMGTDYAPVGLSQGKAFRQSAIARQPLSAGTFLAWFFAALATCFALVWIYVALVPMAFLSRDYPLWQAKRHMLDDCQLGSVAVFGDSRAVAAVMPRRMSVTASNFALSGISPIETYFLVRRALRCPDSPKIVIIAHSVLKYALDTDYWVFDAPVGFLSFSEMRAIDREAARLHDNQIARLQPDKQLPIELRELLYAIRFPPLYFANLVNGYIGARWQHNRNAYYDALKSFGHALFGTASRADGFAVEGMHPVYRTAPLIDFYFSRTIALLARHKIPVYVMSIPINRATAKRMPAALPLEFASYLDGKARQFNNLHVVSPVIPCWPDRYFGDDWHLNLRGAQQYSQELGHWTSRILAGEAAQWNQNRCANVATSTAMATSDASPE